jgi:betaine lipid synthase
MATFLPVDKFFEHVYLVDLSPSLCEVARKRFERLGWKNVTVLCQDARSFSLPEKDLAPQSADGVDLITMSYSLSMIPGEYHIMAQRMLFADHIRLLQRGGFLDLPVEVQWNFGRV